MIEPYLLQQLHKPAHPTWDEFLTESTKNALINIDIKLKNSDFTPSINRVLHFLSLDLSNIKVVIIGQDPYPQKGIATGRAFEVATLKSWNQTFRNVSLKNIIRLIYYTKTNEHLTYKQILPKIENRLFETEFKLAEPKLLFKNWEKQGVLLLNTSFTCEIGNPGSHTILWQEFSNQLLNYINLKNPNIIWILWGKHAQNAVKDICIKNKYISNHPMICKPDENDFLFGNVNAFKETESLIDWTGLT